MVATIPACFHPCKACRDCEPLWPDIDIAAYEAVPLFDPASFSGTVFGKETLDFANVKPARPVDSWQLQSGYYYDDGVARVLVTVGNKCQTATDKERCLAQIEDFQPKPGKVIGFGYALPYTLGSDGKDPFLSVYIVSTEGDAVHLWDTKEKLLEFLGTVDSREEAILVAMAHNFAPARDRKDLSAIREVPDGYEMIARQQKEGHIGGYLVNRALIRISPAGEVRSLREQKWYETQGCD